MGSEESAKQSRRIRLAESGPDLVFQGRARRDCSLDFYFGERSGPRATSVHSVPTAWAQRSVSGALKEARRGRREDLQGVAEPVCGTVAEHIKELMYVALRVQIADVLRLIPARDVAIRALLYFRFHASMVRFIFL